MTGGRATEREGPAGVEVRVFQHGHLVHLERCESEEEARNVVARWTEIDGTECEVDDLSVRHQLGEILEPETTEPAEDEYPSGPLGGEGDRYGSGEAS